MKENRYAIGLDVKNKLNIYILINKNKSSSFIYSEN